LLTTIGKRFITITERAGQFSGFILQIFVSTFKRPIEWREISKQLEMVGVSSFPVVAVTALFTGMVFTLQTYDGFARFGAEGYVPGVLAVALLKELVPVLGGMMIAGRVGSAIAAELGTMKVTDQIDALEVMGTDPVHFLVVPRFLATTLMVPLLITLGDLIGLLGGWYLITYILQTPSPAFLEMAFEFLDPEDYWSGILKASCFGAIIAVVGCYKGLNTRGGAEGVGTATTSAVVLSSLNILIFDFFLTKVLF